MEDEQGNQGGWSKGGWISEGGRPNRAADGTEAALTRIRPADGQLILCDVSWGGWACLTPCARVTD